MKLFENYSRQLESYVKGEIEYTPAMNILLNDLRDDDIYSKLGKYIYDMYSGKIPYFHKQFDPKESRMLMLTGTMFYTSALGPKALRKIFGEPLFHNEFGEGEGSGEYKVDLQGKEYASYFETVNGVDMHIGYDHRGTMVEVSTSASPKAIVEAMKALIDKYHEHYK